MQKSLHGPTHPPDADTAAAPDLIDTLYDVAIDPSSFEAFIDRWLLLTDGPAPDAGVEASDVTRHLARADAVLDRFAASAPGPLARFEGRAALVLDPALRIIAATPPALRLPGVSAGTELPTLADDADGARQLRRALRLRVGQSEDGVSAHRIALGGAERVIHVRRLTEPCGGARLVVLFSDLPCWADCVQAFRATFGLSPSEAEVLRLLLEGCAPRDIAARRGAALDTVRKQLRAIFGKTGVGSQVALIRLALSMADMTAFTLADRGRGAFVVDMHAGAWRQTTALDGRRLAYRVFGDPCGAPVLFLTEKFGLCRWPEAAEAEAARRGLRVIVPIHGGYLGSDPAPAALPLRETAPADVLAVLASESAGRFPIVTNGDTWLATLLACAAPERVSGIVNCPASLPLIAAEEFRHMGKWHRFILAGARHAPHLVPFAVKAGFHLARRVGKDAFIRAVYDGSPGDIAAFDAPGVAEAIIAGSEVALSETHIAHAAYARRVMALVNDDWAPLLASLEGRVPVHCLHGAQDPACPPALLAIHRARWPWMTFEVDPDAGELVLFARWRRMLDLIEAHR